MRGMWRGKKAANYIRRRFKRSAVILMYHRVANLPSDYFQKAVSPENFPQQLDYINKSCHPLSLSELVDALKGNSLPERAVVVTFDDGYVDNYYQALPILESAQIPATFFIITNLIGSKDELWSDKLARILLETDDLPDLLSFELNGQAHNFVLNSGRPKNITFRRVYDVLRPLPIEYRDEKLNELADWAKISLEFRPDFRFMSSEELISLSQHNLVEIGAHTSSHPLLSSLPEDDQYTEIVGSKHNLEAFIDKPVNFFAYPHGACPESSIDIVKHAGFDSAVTTIHDNVRTFDDLYRLPRLNVADWDFDTFKRRIDSFFKL